MDSIISIPNLILRRFFIYLWAGLYGAISKTVKEREWEKEKKKKKKYWVPQARCCYPFKECEMSSMLYGSQHNIFICPIVDKYIKTGSNWTKKKASNRKIQAAPPAFIPRNGFSGTNGIIQSTDTQKWDRHIAHIASTASASVVCIHSLRKQDTFW